MTAAGRTTGTAGIAGTTETAGTAGTRDMVAVVPVRDGQLPVGADESVAEAGGRAVVVGSGVADAAAELCTAVELRLAEVGPVAPAAWAAALAPHLRSASVVVLPASPDGRDLAPRLAHALGRPLLAGAMTVGTDRVSLVRRGGLVLEDHAVTGPVVATLQPGVRGVEPAPGRPSSTSLDLDLPDAVDAELLGVSPPDPATMDLGEARRIVAGGAGLGGPEPFAVLARVAAALGASHGASRVAADVGWAAQDRFIGTTGVVVDPDLYVAFGISGAVQHVTGLGHPRHVVAVNTDASAPMMTMADLAIVTDAVRLLEALDARLGAAPPAAVTGGPGGPGGEDVRTQGPDLVHTPSRRSP